MKNRLFVFGSINLDLVTRVARHPQPGETLHGSNYIMLAGGKGANQALAAALAFDQEPSRTLMIGAVGNDAFGTPALANLKKFGVDLSNTIEVGAGTGIALIAIDKHGENAIIVCPGANDHIYADQIKKAGLAKGDILLTQQEGNLEEIWKAHSFARQQGATVIHNAAPALETTTDTYKNIDVLIINEIETREIGRLTGIAESSAEDIARDLADMFGLVVILTLGSQGVFGVFRKTELKLAAPTVEVVDTTGAGDTFCGVFAASLLMGKDYPDALQAGLNAASLACTRLGAQQT